MVLQEIQEIGKVGLHDAAPRNAGVLLTFTGTVALIMGIAEYCLTLRMLCRSYLFRRARPSLLMALVMATAGVLLCFGIADRLL
jgi:hypothetical protein